MREEILCMIKDKVEKEKESIIAYNNGVKRLQKLLQDEKVKEYLNLSGQLGNNPELKTLSGQSIVDSAVRSLLYKINSEETNGIFVCLGTYKNSIETDIIHGPSAIRESYDSPSAEYRVYCDIEQESYTAMEIPIAKCEQFEQEHIVIFPTTFLENLYYKQIQQDFFDSAIKDGQKTAKEKILCKYAKQIRKK